MIDAALQIWFGINRENYGSLIGELLAEVEAQNGGAASRDITDARKAFIETGIARGVPVEELVSLMRGLNASDLFVAARRLPDKQAAGAKGNITSFTAEDRRAFAEAGAARPEDVRWDILFPDGKDDLVLDFFGDGRSFADKIQEFLDTHNARARALYERERAGENISADIKEMSPVERKFFRQLLKRDPADPSRLYMAKPPLENGEPVFDAGKVSDWKDGPRLGKYLQDAYAWELYEVFSREVNDAKKKEQKGSRASNKYDSLRDIANHEQLFSDSLFDAGLLQIVVSRDPQKIGEESTGQRWASCMARDGCNFAFVSEDIKAGALVAYVVYKGDTEARYPLMRVLLKPYHKQLEGGGRETILVPALVYGAYGGESSRTSDALIQTLNQFVGQQNAGKSGEFIMDEHLYGDGQVETVFLEGAWPVDSIKKALLKYQESSLTEWMTEINMAMGRIARGEKGPNDEDPAEKLRTMRSAVRRLFDNDNKNTGLPRMFFRSIAKTSIGARPEPKDVIKAVSESDAVASRGAAFRALVTGDGEAWRAATAAWPQEFRNNLLFAGLMAGDFKSAEEARRAVKVCLDDFMPGVPEGSLTEYLLQLRLFADANASLKGPVHSLHCAFAAAFPEIADADLVASFANWSAGSRTNASSLSRELSDHALKNIAAFNPDLVRNVFGALRTVESEKPYARKRMLVILAALVDADPSLVDKRFVQKLLDTAVSDVDGEVRAVAFDTLAKAVGYRPQFATQELMDAVLSGALYDTRDASAKNAQACFGVLLRKRPEFAGKATIEAIEKALVLDEDGGGTNDSAVKNALACLGVVVKNQPSLADSISIGKLFAVGEVKRFFSAAFGILEGIATARPDLITSAHVEELLRIRHSKPNETKAVFDVLTCVIGARRDLAEGVLSSCLKTVKGTDVTAARASDTSIRQVYEAHPDLVTAVDIESIVGLAIAGKDLGFLDGVGYLLKTVLPKRPDVITKKFADSIWAKAETDEDAGVRYRALNIMLDVVRECPEHTTQAMRDGLLKLGKEDVSEEVRQTALTVFSAALSPILSITDDTQLKKLAEILVSENSRNVLHAAYYSFNKALEGWPAVASVGLIDCLLEGVERAGSTFESYALYGVRDVIKRRPDLATKKTIQKFLDIARKDKSSRYEVMCRIRETVELKPELADAYLVRSLVDLSLSVSDVSAGINIRGALESVLKVKPDIIVPGLVQELLHGAVESARCYSSDNGTKKALLSIFEGSKAMTDSALLADLVEKAFEPRLSLLGRNLIQDLVFHRPELATEKIVQSLRGVAESDADFEKRFLAIEVCLDISQVPGAVDDRLFDVIKKLAADPEDTTRQRSQYLLERAVLALPERASSELIAELMDRVLNDRNRDVRQSAVSVVGGIGKAYSDIISDPVYEQIEAIGKTDGFLGYNAKSALEKIREGRLVREEEREEAEKVARAKVEKEPEVYLKPSRRDTFVSVTTLAIRPSCAS